MLKLVIVEDERDVREGLRYLLGLDARVRISGAFAKAEEMLEYLGRGNSCDLVLMDIHLPGITGIEACRKLRAAYPALPVLILTVFEDEDTILDAIKAGANGYILKTTRPESLLEQIFSAAEGGSPISPSVGSRLLEEIRRSQPQVSAVDYGLTSRELEVLQDIVNGLTYRELAERHHIAGSTAKKHILHIYQKLNVNSRAEVVRKALEERLV
ncbi:MAG: response regulator transcription factor [Spirochaetes bacterium]|nr:response regulator transcription factor [Spirochaetota bacterium]MBU0955726.1 response regulator transcription factor [Spirochaetota bacterium]